MASHALQAATAALQAQFGPYLGHRPEVEHSLHGRGVLVGLPGCHINDGQPLGSVEFASQPGGYFPDFHELSGLKLVLFDPAELLGQRGGLDHFGDSYPKQGLLFSSLELDLLAQMVDSLRALGIALNLPAGSWIRKEVSRG